MNQQQRKKNNQQIALCSAINQMSEKQQFLLIKPSSSQLQKNLCYIDKDESEEIIELKFQDQNYQKMLESEFIKYLDQNSKKKIKIITIFGQQGEGKSFIQNFLIQKYEQKQEFNLIFPFGQNCESQTKGIDFYLIQNKQKENEITVFFDCEGFDYSNKSSYMKSLQKLICLITRISTCVLYVHQNPRKPKHFDEILNLIKAKDKSESQMIHNFIEIVNKWNGDSFESFKQNNKYSQIISKSFFLNQISFQKPNKEEEKQNIITKIKQDENYQDFIKEIDNITEFCKNSKYKTSFNNCKAFEQDQTCQSLKEMLLCSFQSIQENIDVSLGDFISIINEQFIQKKQFTNLLNQKSEEMLEQYKSFLSDLLGKFKGAHISFALLNFSLKQFILDRQESIKQELQQFVQQWKQNFKRKLEEIITVNSINLTEERKQLIIQQYSNLESFQPQEFKMIELLVQQKENTTNSFDIYLILKVIFFSFVAFLAFLFSLQGIKNFFLKGIQYILFPKQRNLQSNLIKQVTSKISMGQFNKGNSKQNIQHLREIILTYSSEEQLAYQSDFFVFLTFFNLSHSSIQNFKNHLNGFEVDNQVLQSCLKIFKEDIFMNSINLQLIYDSPSAQIKDQDFEFDENYNQIFFKSNELKNNCTKIVKDLEEHKQHFYKMLYFLKNRNIDLLQTFISEAYFDDFIYSEDFAEKINNETQIQGFIKFQKSLI